MSKCKGCGASIKWVKMTSTGKMMPVDDKPIRVVLITNEYSGEYGGHVEKAFMPHWATCVKAKHFKKGDHHD